jgi:hypothetical protein
VAGAAGDAEQAAGGGALKPLAAATEITTLCLVLWAGWWWLPANWQRCQMVNDPTLTCLMQPEADQ